MESSISQRLKVFIKAKGLSVRAFERLCELPNNWVASIKNGISSDKMSNITRQFPEISMGWILTGEGQMLTDSEQISQSGTKNIQQNAKGNHITQRADGFNFDRVLALLEKNTELMGNTLEKKDEQMDKLLEIIANLSKQ